MITGWFTAGSHPKSGSHTLPDCRVLDSVNSPKQAPQEDGKHELNESEEYQLAPNGFPRESEHGKSHVDKQIRKIGRVGHITVWSR